ncbi:alpha/beta hydrolase family protein [Halocola ammonii]
MHKFLIVFVALALVSVGCDKSESIETGSGIQIRGTGTFTFDQFSPLANKPVQVFYHIPQDATEDTPILMVFHGAGRDAQGGRDALISAADQRNFIVVAPEFSDEFYPGGDSYNLGNIFVDGDNPTPQTLNPEEEWTFSVVDPIFEYVKSITGSTQPSYDVFGHSAGGQFVHRLVIFKPNAKFNRVVAAASGWYTMPDDEVIFPYGLEESPRENLDLSNLYSTSITVMIGSADNDPNAPGLRHNIYADAQGDDRLERAQYFYNENLATAQSLNISWNWNYQLLPNVGHDFEATSSAAVVGLY